MRLILLFGLATLAAGLSVAPSSAQHGEHGGSVVGETIEPTDAFARGLHLLHNFEYDRARAAFQQARAADPNNVMAAWGEAMSHNYPLWMDVDLDEGRAALAKLGATSAERHAKARNEKQHLYLAAIEALYAGPTKIARDIAYNQAMEAMFERFPDDVDVRSFTALSIMGLAHNGREVPLYMRAAAMLEEVYPDNQKHPGVLHYMIHAYDDPTHAPLGLRAAQRYAAVAPDAGHAMHMISHIYLALGNWPEVERANVAAMGIVNGQRAAAGKGATACGHYAEWLVYAQLQQGRDPRSLVDSCRRQVEQAAIAKDGPMTGNAFGSWSDMASRIAVETGRAPAAPPKLDEPFPTARFWTAYGAMIADGPQQAAARRALAASGPEVLAGLARNRPNDKSTPGWISAGDCPERRAFGAGRGQDRGRVGDAPRGSRGGARAAGRIRTTGAAQAEQRIAGRPTAEAGAQGGSGVGVSRNACRGTGSSSRPRGAWNGDRDALSGEEISPHRDPARRDDQDDRTDGRQFHPLLADRGGVGKWQDRSLLGARQEPSRSQTQAYCGGRSGAAAGMAVVRFRSGRGGAHRGLKLPGRDLDRGPTVSRVAGWRSASKCPGYRFRPAFRYRPR